MNGKTDNVTDRAARIFPGRFICFILKIAVLIGDIKKYPPERKETFQGDKMRMRNLFYFWF